MNDDQTRLKKPMAAKFFLALSSGREEYLPEVENLLAEQLGELDFRSRIYRFSDFSRYYDSETGGPVWKYLCCLKDLRFPEELVRIKLLTESVQGKFLTARENRECRDVNIDPGYLNGWQVVLASVKNFTHRIYLEQGVYAETTLLFQKGNFLKLPWTYADYLSEPVLDFLSRVRSEWNKQHKDLS